MFSKVFSRAAALAVAGAILATVPIVADAAPARRDTDIQFLGTDTSEIVLAESPLNITQEFPLSGVHLIRDWSRVQFTLKDDSPAGAKVAPMSCSIINEGRVAPRCSYTLSRSQRGSFPVYFHATLMIGDTHIDEFAFERFVKDPAGGQLFHAMDPDHMAAKLSPVPKKFPSYLPLGRESEAMLRVGYYGTPKDVSAEVTAADGVTVTTGPCTTALSQLSDYRYVVTCPIRRTKRFYGPRSYTIKVTASDLDSSERVSMEYTQQVRDWFWGA